MARTPRQSASSSEPPLPSIDPNRRYRVYLKNAVRMGKYGNTVMTPRTKNIMAGYLVSSLDPADIERYEPVE